MEQKELQKKNEIAEKIRAKIKKEKGQTAVEYMLIIAVIVAVIFTLGKVFKTEFESLSKTIFSKIKGNVAEGGGQ